jgi:hypothetical protein
VRQALIVQASAGAGRETARRHRRAQRELDAGVGGAIVAVVAVERWGREVAAEIAGQRERVDLLRRGASGQGDVLGQERPGPEQKRRADLGGRRGLGRGEIGGGDPLPVQVAEVAIDMLGHERVGRDEVGVGAGLGAGVDERMDEVSDRRDQAGRQVFEAIDVEERGQPIGLIEDDRLAGGVVAERAAAGGDAE